ncbi:MAG: hypothetical protein R3E87_25170 [Burkholderiaceae bacterium]
MRAGRRRFGLATIAGAALSSGGRRRLGRAAMAGAAWLAGTRNSTATSSRSTRFTFIGDTSYDAAEAADLRRLLPIATADVDFTVHVGDIKSGLESCEDAVLEHHLYTLASTGRPMVYVPGDNEWTDCHRLLAGSYDPLERLSRLRELAYRPHRFLDPAGLERQTMAGVAWPEHQRWRSGPALFTTLNVPGSDDALRTRIAEIEHRRRATAVTAWLIESAKRARNERLPVLVVAIHADTAPGSLHARDLDADVIDLDNPYGWFRALLWQVVCAFPGQVLLLNGDLHVVWHDRPWRNGQFAGNAADRFAVPLATVQSRMAAFQRVQCFGSPSSKYYLTITIAATPDQPAVIDVRTHSI